MTSTDNPNCPDYSSHYQNALDELFPDHDPVALLTRHQDELVSHKAHKDYLDCEGH